MQSAIDSRSVLPVASCVKADKYSLKDFIPRTIDYYTVEGTLSAMPFNVSNPVFYYNQQAFEKAGLDPSKPPTTLDEVKDAAQKIVDAGVTTRGYAIKLDPWYLEQWLAKAGKTLRQRGQRPEVAGDGDAFDNPIGVEIFAWLKDMVDSGLAVEHREARGQRRQPARDRQRQRRDDDRLVGEPRDDHAGARIGPVPERRRSASRRCRGPWARAACSSVARRSTS